MPQASQFRSCGPGNVQKLLLPNFPLIVLASVCRVVITTPNLMGVFSEIIWGLCLAQHLL